MRKIIFLAAMLISLSLQAQPFEFEFGSHKNYISKVIFRDTLGRVIDQIDVRMMNPFNHLEIPVKSTNDDGNNTYIGSRLDFLALFPQNIRKTFVDSINIKDIDSVELFSESCVSKTENNYIVINYHLMASDPKYSGMYGSKGMIYIIDSTNKTIFKSEVIPSASGFASISKGGKYLAYKYGNIGPDEVIYPDGIQIREVTSNKIVYNIEALNYGVVYDEKCQMIRTTIMIADKLRYLFLDERLKGFYYIDLNDNIARILTINKESIIIENSNHNKVEIKFNQMSKILF